MILVPKQLNFIRAFPVHATVSSAEHAALPRVESACGEVDVLRLDFQLPTAPRDRPSLGRLEQRRANAVLTPRRRYRGCPRSLPDPIGPQKCPTWRVVGHRHAADAVVIDSSDHDSPLRRIEAPRPLRRCLGDRIVVLQIRRLDSTLGENESTALQTIAYIKDCVDLEDDRNTGVFDERSTRDVGSLDLHFVWATTSSLENLLCLYVCQSAVLFGPRLRCWE